MDTTEHQARTWRNQFHETFAVPDELDRLVKFGLLEDTSCSNDIAPSFEFDGYEGSKETERRFHREGLKPSRYRLWVDAEKPELREFDESKRFSLFFRDEDERERTDDSVLFNTDDVNEMVEAITMRFFQSFAWSIDDGPWVCPFRDCESDDVDNNDSDFYACNDCGRVWTLLAQSRITGAVIEQGLRQCRDCDRTEGLIVSKCEGVKLQFCAEDYKVHTSQWCEECPKLAEVQR